MPDFDQQIRDAAAFAWAAAERLDHLLVRSCPGQHLYVQHRDRRAPWCNACRYTAAGVKVPREDDQSGRTDLLCVPSDGVCTCGEPEGHQGREDA